MDERTKEALQQLREIKALPGQTQVMIAERLGVHQPTVGRWLKPGFNSDIDVGNISAIEAYYLELGLGQGDRPRPEPTRRTSPNASFPPLYQAFPNSSVPLMGRTVGGPNGKFIMSGSQIGRVFCPPGLEGVEDAYALQVLGNSAYPRFKEGQTVWINPHAPYVKGDDVVVQVTTDDEEYPTESYIKEYVSRAGGLLHLRQHNPGPGESHEIEFDLKNVYSIHKVVFAAMT